MDNEKDKKQESTDQTQLSPKISNVVTAILVTATICCAGAAFFMNKYIHKDDDKPIKVYYNTSASESSAAQEESDSTKASQAAKTVSTRTEKTTSAKKASAAETKTTLKTTSAAEPVTEYVFPADINSVDFDQLTAINGVGNVTAQKIIDFRSANGKIRNMEMLLEIDGIGASTLELLENYLYVSAADYSETVRLTETSAAVVSTTSTTSKAAETTTTAATTRKATTTSQSETTVRRMKTVNINSASAQELAECLLLDIETAEAIVELRTNIQYFSNYLELLYVDGFSEEMLLERRAYITLS